MTMGTSASKAHDQPGIQSMPMTLRFTYPAELRKEKIIGCPISRDHQEPGSSSILSTREVLCRHRESGQFFKMIQHVLKRFSQAAIGLDPPVPKLSFDPFTQLLHHRAAISLVILEPLLFAHPLRPVVVPVDFPNRLQHLPALDGEDLFKLFELPSTMR